MYNIREVFISFQENIFTTIAYPLQYNTFTTMQLYPTPQNAVSAVVFYFLKASLRLATAIFLNAVGAF